MPRLLPLLLLALPAVAADPPDPAAAEHFEKSVRPVLIERCGECHIQKAKGGLKLTGRESLLKGGDLGPAVVPGDAAKSLLVKTLSHAGELKMPPDGRLKAAEVEAITKWVNDGAPWPAGDTSVSVKPDGPLFTKEQKEFWAFQPVKRPPVPANPDPKAGGDNPIDAFILARLAKEKLTLSPPADKRTLVRRIHFDLTGLPPTPERLAAFEKDTSPDAFAKVVDDLLASPHYGERWGRHWLDVARYADSNGMDENTLFGNAWKYRDYVVNSLNADKPYSQFLREQIAGDLLPEPKTDAERKERFAALGFLALGPKLLAEPDKQKMLLDIADEQLDTLGKSVMGLTLGCARCHDHKFDPLPTRDYYSLFAVFTSTRTMQNLNTVAKTFERVATPPDSREAEELRGELVAAKKELKKLEAEFGKTPEADAAKRKEIHEKAEVQRATIKKVEPKLPPLDAYLGVEEGTAAAYGTQPRNLFVQVRGNYTTPGTEAPAMFPRILAGEEQTPFVKTTAAAGKGESNKTRFGGGRSASGRLELANWLTDGTHPLTARVMVNRIWLHHFGEGLVRTPDNFGRLGERPTHPELLDWLASEMMIPAEGKPWALKRMHKLIVTSRTYQQSAGSPPPNDVENKFLSVFPRRRLDAESIRDAILSVSGQLDRKVGGTLLDGPNLDYVREVKYDAPRRSIYLPVIRGKLFPFFLTFDFPDPGVTVGKRATTTVAPQALWLLNSPFVTAQADALAAKVVEQREADRAKWLYRRTLLRDPTKQEAVRLDDFVAVFAVEKDGVRKGWAAAVQAVLASSEFFTVD